MYELTITAVGNLALQDELGLEAMAPEAQFRGVGVSAGVTTVVRMTSATWDRVRPRLRALTQRRTPVLDGAGLVIPGCTQPVCFYSMVEVPGRNPRINQIEQTAALDLVTNGVLTLRGTNLLAGIKAKLDIWRQDGSPIKVIQTGQATFNAPVKIMTITANAVGPIGDKIGVRIEPDSGAGSVSTRMFADGRFEITVVPAASTNTATAIAAQIAGNSMAASLVTATAIVGAAKVPPTTEAASFMQPPQVVRATHQYLKGGDGGGLAILDVPVVDGVMTNRLRLTAQKAGNPSNQIALVLRMSQGGNTVTVSGTTITVNRTGATETIANLVSAINGNASAAALVVASAVGAGSLGALTLRYLYGGAAEEPVATIGGAPAVVTGHTDSVMVLSVLAADLVTAGATTGEEMIVQVIYGDTQIQGQVNLAA